MNADIAEKLKKYASETENALEACFKVYTGKSELENAMKYALLGGGKRIRAFLTLTFAEMFGVERKSAMPFACAVEMVHAYSLIHDDLPCMDNDDMRRGKPSCHKKFGEATALLAGDALLTLAFGICASNRYVSDKSGALAVSALSELAGYRGMCLGQEIDLSENAGTYDELKKLHSLKTAALIKAACLLGLYAACDSPDDSVLQRISEYAECLGLAFQIHDDILDVKGDSVTLGKPVGSDEKNGKKTVLSFMTLSEAMEEEKILTGRASKALADYSGSEVLSELAVYLMSRNK